VEDKTSQVDILLVEDNPNDAELALRALRMHNLANHIVHVKDGEEALEYLFARGQYEDRDIEDMPRVVLLDLNLPKVGGLEVLKTIKDDVSLKVTPVVVLTTSKEERDLLASYRLGANSYIVKPVDFEKLVEAVKGLGYYWLLLNERP